MDAFVGDDSTPSHSPSPPCSPPHSPSPTSQISSSGDWCSACLWNARSLGNKLKPFQAFVYSSQLQIFAVTETWLHSSIMDGEIIASGFTLYRKDRESRGDGVLLAIHDSIPSSAAMSWFHWNVGSFNPCSTANCSVPCVPSPQVSGNVIHALINYLTELHSFREFVLLGDFNLSDVDWSSLSGTKYQLFYIHRVCL